MFQTTLPTQKTWDEEVSDEKTLANFERWYLKTYGKATSGEMHEYLEREGLISPKFKKLTIKRKAVRYMGRKMADLAGFVGIRAYDPRTQNTSVFWKYCNV